MAYGIKYKFDYRSPMREKLVYQVSISERDYDGEVHLLKPIGEDFKITQGQIDDNELVPTKDQHVFAAGLFFPIGLDRRGKAGAEDLLVELGQLAAKGDATLGAKGGGKIVKGVF